MNVVVTLRRVCKTFYPMVNVDASPVHFIDPKEQFKVIKDARNRAEVPLVVYHSHPESWRVYREIYVC